MDNIFESWLCNKFIAHRGLHGDGVPENSLAAYQKAIDKGYAIEIDVRPLADGTIVSFHDDELDRLTKHKGLICEKTSEQIKDYVLNNSKEKIPTLQEVLDLVDGKVPLLVEIKNQGKVGFEKNVYELLKAYKGEYAVQSFNPLSLGWFAKNAPEVKRGQLASFYKKDNLGKIKKFLLKRMLLNNISKPHFVSYKVEDIPNKYVDKAKKKGLPILAWSVRSQTEFERVKGYVSNIIFEYFEPKK